ncbi:MAG: SH3 domain-containing protein [Cyanothece sp. SIO1E1]|nr:SH3 domain-containing protein [Cyanothece sp. SIO1E1]
MNGLKFLGWVAIASLTWVSGCTHRTSSSTPTVSAPATVPEASDESETANIEASAAATKLPEQSSEVKGNSTAEPFTRQPLLLKDQAKPAADFFQFRQQLRQAVKNREVEFIRAIAAPDIKLSFGGLTDLDNLNISDPNALVWQHLERAIAIGCAQENYQSEVNTARETEARWVCPQVFLASDLIETADPFEQVFIVGEKVNVRAAPNNEGAVVDTLSHEVVKYDEQSIADLSEQQLSMLETFDGWIPVVIPDGQRGYVSSRYAYSPIGYRAFFSQVDGEWQMTVFLAGD